MHEFKVVSLLVWWYEKEACSTVACTEVLVSDAGTASENQNKVLKAFFSVPYLHTRGLLITLFFGAAVPLFCGALIIFFAAQNLLYYSI